MLPKMLTTRIMENQFFYSHLIMQLAFIGNSDALLDYIHRTWVLVERKFHEERERDSAHTTPYNDEYEYQIGFYEPYHIVIFAVCLLFSTIVPLISFFGMLYFNIKYYVDKHKLIFVYMKKYESDCGTRSSAKHLMFVSLYIYLIIMTCLYSLEFANFTYFYAGCLAIVFWSIIIFKLENTQDEEVGDLLKHLKIKRHSLKE